MFIEFFKPSKKNLLALYFLQMFPYTPKIFDNSETCDLIAIRIITIILIYIYSKVARGELQNYYNNFLNILLSYLRKAGAILTTYAIIYLTVWVILPKSIDFLECVFGIYAIYQVVKYYYIPLFKGLSAAWHMPKR